MKFNKTGVLAVYSDLRQKILNDLHTPKHWIAEGVQEPNDTAKLHSCMICWKIYIFKDLLPSRIAPTKEDGVYIAYDREEMSLIIEAYNDGDIALIVCNDQRKTVIYSEDVENMNFEKAINIFLKRNNP